MTLVDNNGGQTRIDEDRQHGDTLKLTIEEQSQ